MLGGSFFELKHAANLLDRASRLLPENHELRPRVLLDLGYARFETGEYGAAEAALQKVAERWEQITNAHGRESQRRAYLKHLQISE